MAVEVWIYVRGLTRGTGHWADFPELAKKKWPEAHHVFLDLPGNGENHGLVSPLLMKDYVPFLREELRQKENELGISNPMRRVLSISMGAMVCTAWMREYPGEIHQAFFINTSSGSTSRFFRRLKPQNYLSLIEAAKKKDWFFREQKILQATSLNHEAQKKWIEKFAEYDQSHPVRLSNLARQLVAASLFQLPSQPPGSIRLLASRRDNLVDFSCSLELSRVWKLPLDVHPSAGHDLPLDDPDWLLDTVGQNLH